MSEESQRREEVRAEVRRSARAQRPYLAGHVTGATGAIVGGTGGFTVLRFATGAYAITWDPPLKRAPTVVATADASSVTRSAQTNGLATTTGVEVRVFNNANALVDGDFTFVAVL